MHNVKLRPGQQREQPPPDEGVTPQASLNINEAAPDLLRLLALRTEGARPMITLDDRDGAPGLQDGAELGQSLGGLFQVFQNVADEDVVEIFLLIRQIENVRLAKLDVRQPLPVDKRFSLVQ